MTYQIRWKRTALDELATAWISAGSDTRRAITRAAQELERRMKTDAHDLGESRSGDERIAFQSPLAVVFEVEPEHAVVRVLQVWPY